MSQRSTSDSSNPRRPANADASTSGRSGYFSTIPDLPIFETSPGHQIPGRDNVDDAMPRHRRRSDNDELLGHTRRLSSDDEMTQWEGLQGPSIRDDPASDSEMSGSELEALPDFDEDGDLEMLEENQDPLREDQLEWSGDYSTFLGAPEVFDESSGPTIDDKDPLDIFRQFWDQPIMEYIRDMTNLYAMQKIKEGSVTGIPVDSKLLKWTDTTVEELYLLFTMFLMMGIGRRARVSEHWQTGFLEKPGFKKVMSYDRFMMLTKFLHFVDNTTLVDTEPLSERRLCKMSLVLDYMNRKFKMLYKPQKELSIGKTLPLWEGSSNSERCVGSKDKKFAIKTFELYEAATGYCLSIIMYIGKEKALYGFKEHTAKVVLKLLRGFLEKGHTICMNNFYNSVRLARFLKSKKTDVVGTLNRHREETPVDVKNIKERDLRRGDVIARHCGNVSVMAWKNYELHSTISTYHNTDMARTIRGGQPLEVPQVFQSYKKAWRGANLKYENVTSYLEEKTGHKWYVKGFRRLMIISTYNMHLIHRMQESEKPHLYIDFCYELIQRLVDTYRTVTPVRKRTNIELTHYPDQIPIPDDKRKHKKEHKYKRRNCVNCAKKRKRTATYFFCRGCEAFICLGNCWSEHHLALEATA